MRRYLSFFFSVGFLLTTSCLIGQTLEVKTYSSPNRESVKIAVKMGSPFCEGSPMTLTASIVSKDSTNNKPIDSNSFTYTWHWGFLDKIEKSGRQIITNESGRYKVYATSLNGGRLYAEFEIPKDPGAFYISHDKWICGNQLADINISFDNSDRYRDDEFLNALKFEWPQDGIFPTNVSCDVATVEDLSSLEDSSNKNIRAGCAYKPGDYTLIVTNTQNQCRYEKEFTIKKIERPEMKIVCDKEELCYGMKGTLTYLPQADTTLKFKMNWPENPRLIDQPGKHGLILWELESECSFLQEFEVKKIDYQLKLNKQVYNFCDKEQAMLSIETNLKSDQAVYEWFNSGNDGKWAAIPNSNKRSIPLLERYSTKVTATTKEGCILTDRVSNSDVIVSNNSIDYFKSQGFYELKITDIENIESEGKQNLCNNTITSDNRLYDDSFVQSFKLADEVVTNLDEIIESHLEYFQNQYFKDRSDVSAFLTSNNSLCACPDYIQKVKSKFQAQDYAFWIHIYEDENGNGSLFVLSNNKKSDGTVVNFPGTGKGQIRRKNLVDKFLNILYSEQVHGENFESMPDNIIFIVMNSLLDVFGNL